MTDMKTVTDAAKAFADSVNALANTGAHADIPAEVLQNVFTAAVRAYAAHCEKHGGEPAIVDNGFVNATEGVVAACALVRAIDINMFDMTMWYNRSGNNRV